MQKRHQLNMGYVALAFAAGAAAGAVSALLTSPRTGKDNREALRRSARDLRDRATESVSGLQARIARASRALSRSPRVSDGSPSYEMRPL